jgi:hypothetical protein
MAPLEDDFEERLASICPRAGGLCRPASPQTTRYNCLAWAVRDEDKPWYPRGDPRKSRWPADAPETLDIPSVVRTLELVGYEVCPPGDGDPDFERIVLFEDTEGFFAHAARQLPDGRWTSKLGTWEDIEHDDPECLEGGDYGSISCFLRKRASTGPR